MKKFLTLSVVAILLVALMIPSFAAFVQEEDLLNVKFEIKKATTAWKGDGVLSDGEYYKINQNPHGSPQPRSRRKFDYAKNLMPILICHGMKLVYFASVYTVKIMMQMGTQTSEHVAVRLYPDELC